MFGFLSEFGRFVITVWGQAWRWTLRKRRNLLVTFSIVVVAFAVFATVTQTANQDAPVAGPAPTPAPSATVKYSQVDAVPVSEAPQSTAAAATTQGAQTGTLAQPEEPVVDRRDPESVAKGWAVAYLSRPSAEWSDWRNWIAPYTMPDVLAQMQTQAYQPDQSLDGKAPAVVTKVEIAPAAADAETSTAIRWSRNLVVEIMSEDKSTTTMTYGIVLTNSDDGWTVTAQQEIAVSG